MLQNLNLSPNLGRPLLLMLSNGVRGGNVWKPSLVMIAALVMGSSFIAYAQQRDYDGGAHFEHYRLSPEDRAAFVDARIAALKAGLELTSDQAKNWPTFEQALRDMAQLRAQLRTKHDSEQPVRAYDAPRRQHGQGKRCAQAYRGRGHTALPESERRTEGAL
jgi:hypothetical protein